MTMIISTMASSQSGLRKSTKRRGKMAGAEVVEGGRRDASRGLMMIMTLRMSEKGMELRLMKVDQVKISTNRHFWAQNLDPTVPRKSPTTKTTRKRKK